MLFLTRQPSLVLMHSKKKKNRRGALSIHCSRMLISPVFWGELGNHVARPYITESQKSLPLQDPCDMPLVRSKTRNSVEGQQLMAIQHVQKNAKDVFVQLPDQQVAIRSYCLPHIHFEKAETTHRHHRLGYHTTVLHGAASRCSHIFYQLFLCVTIC